jgi:hypothetical protein
VYLRFIRMCCATVLLAGSVAFGRDEAAVETPPSFESVAWAGPAPVPAYLEGKTLVVLTYVTWCPKCNAWTGKVAGEIKQQANDKPIVVFAISTDTPPAEAFAYMNQRGLVGPNIFHGSDPSIAKRFGFANEFINYAIVNPDGKVVNSGNAGTHYTDSKKPEYAPARYLESSEDLGRFRFLKPDMPAPLKERLWLLELGVSREVKKLELGLSPADRDLLRSAVESFLATELAQVEQRSQAPSLADKLSAADKATEIVSNFGTSPEGRRAKEILATFAKDKQLKNELAAKRLYEAALKIPDPGRRNKAMEGVVKKFPDTEYGKKATQPTE